VDLKEGNNLILVKAVKEGGTQWAFLFDLLDPDSHERISDLSYSPAPAK
jgi:hypothetical protein